MSERSATSLVPRPSTSLRPASPASPASSVGGITLPRSLDEVQPGAMLFLDGNGDLLAPWKYRAAQLVDSAAWMALIAVASLGFALGPAGLLGPLLLTALYISVAARRQAAWRPLMLYAQGRLDDAAACCEEEIGRARSLRGLAIARHCLGAIEARRGNHRAALLHVREARRLCEGDLRLRASAELLALEEIWQLVNVEEVAEARALLDRRRPPERGEVAKVRYLGVDLYVQFAERRLTLDDEALWERARRALRLSSGASLLALCAWAHAERRDEEMAAHLIEQARDRYVPSMRGHAPSLWEWVEQRSGPLPEAGDDVG
ncbi:MAG: hypothetical protein EXR72_20930 [Myxococcales bacterium]|nr:hypothetical protein [Myxococcales bacterium]